MRVWGVFALAPHRPQRSWLTAGACAYVWRRLLMVFGLAGFAGEPPCALAVSSRVRPYSLSPESSPSNRRASRLPDGSRAVWRGVGATTAAPLAPVGSPITAWEDDVSHSGCRVVACVLLSDWASCACARNAGARGPTLRGFCPFQGQCRAMGILVQPPGSRSASPSQWSCVQYWSDPRGYL